MKAAVPCMLNLEVNLTNTVPLVSGNMLMFCVYLPVCLNGKDGKKRKERETTVNI